MRRDLLETLRPAAVLVGLFTLITGLVYPLAIWIACHDIFAFEAEGSLLADHGKVVGSRLIGQEFSDPRHLWGRPSATGPFPYNAEASSGSNLGPLNPVLFKTVKARIDALRTADSTLTGPIPVDLCGLGQRPRPGHRRGAHRWRGSPAPANGPCGGAGADRASRRARGSACWARRVLDRAAVNLDLDGIHATNEGER
jgi:hypothetical protein